MISFITSFKPFDSKYGPIQRSALYSWKINNIPIFANYIIPIWWTDNLIKAYNAAFNEFQITKLFGVKIGLDLGYKNDCPLINDLLQKGIAACKTPTICLINADVIIRKDFKETVEKIFSKYGKNIFLTGTRFDINLSRSINSPDSLEELVTGKAHIGDEASSAEIFIGSTKLFRQMAKSMDPMIMGRWGWDNYIHFWMVANKVPCYNCTSVLPIYHCRHDHSHIESLEGASGKNAPSSVHNLTYLKKMQNLYGQSIRINKWQKITL